MFNRLGIAQRIYGSFGILIALLAAVCVAAYIGLISIIGLLSDFRSTTHQTEAVSTLVPRLQAEAPDSATADRIGRGADLLVYGAISETSTCGVYRVESAATPPPSTPRRA